MLVCKGGESLLPPFHLTGYETIVSMWHDRRGINAMSTLPDPPNGRKNSSRKPWLLQPHPCVPWVRGPPHAFAAFQDWFRCFGRQASVV